MEQKTKQSFFLLQGPLLTAFLGYALLLFWNLLHHEPWRDEAQAWLIARDLNFLELIKNISYEGSPPLWHLLLMPFAKLHFSYFTISIVHGLLALATVWIWLAFSPFEKIFKIFFIFTYLMGFEYAVIARNYVFSFLFLFLIAHFFKTRCTHPKRYAVLIVLLALTNSHSFILSGILFSEWILFHFLKSNHTLKIIWSITTVVFFLILLTLLQQPGQLGPTSSDWSSIILILNNAFWPTVYKVLPGLFFLISLVVLGLGLYLIFRSYSLVYLFIMGLAGLFYLYLRCHLGTIRHHVLILGWLLMLLWIAQQEFQLKEKVWKILKNILQVSFVCGVCIFIGTTYLETSYNFSGAKEAEDFLKRSGLDHQPIVATRCTAASALLPYFHDLKFYYPEFSRLGTYIQFNTPQTVNTLTEEDLWRALQENTAPKNPILLLNFPLSSTDLKEGYELVYESNAKKRTPILERAFNEYFYIYVKKI